MRMWKTVSSPVVWLAILVVAIALPAVAQDPYWQGSGDDILNTNPGRVIVGGISSGSNAAFQVGDETNAAFRLHQIGALDHWLELGIAVNAGWYSPLTQAGDSVIRGKKNLILLSALDSGSIQFGIGAWGSNERVFALFDRSTGSRVSAYDSGNQEIFSILNNGTTKVKSLTLQAGGNGKITFSDGTMQTTACVPGAGGGSYHLDAADGSPANVVYVDNSGMVTFHNGRMVVKDEPNPDHPTLAVNGRIRTEILEITGGADLAEPFQVTENGLSAEPGFVVSIDAENPGFVTTSLEAYDRKIAGVISGAGGVKPGVVLTAVNKDSGLPVALSGRVWVHATAANGAIQPGDLLTTSNVPGFAMRVTDHARAQGAILGKAMTGLATGEGLVFALVTLQ